MPHRRDDAIRERPGDEQVTRRARETTPADEVLALQRSAGNQAVSAMLARAPKDQPKEAAPAGPTAEGKSIGTIALDSVSLDTTRLAATGSRNRDLPKDLHVTSQLGGHSSQLAQAAANGTVLGDIEIHVPHGNTTIVLTISNAMIASYQVSGQSESWQLVGDAMSFRIVGDEEGKKDTPKKTGGGWDTSERVGA